MYLFALHVRCFFLFFFFNDTATTEIYTLSLHDALPISPRAALPAAARRRSRRPCGSRGPRAGRSFVADRRHRLEARDRKSTRLNSSHLVISYAVFCLKKKKSISTAETVLKVPKTA